MLSLITAVLVAAQPTPAPQERQMSQGHTAGMHHEQPESMKKDCCKDCCKDMANKQQGQAEHSGHSVR